MLTTKVNEPSTRPGELIRKTSQRQQQQFQSPLTFQSKPIKPFSQHRKPQDKPGVRAGPGGAAGGGVRVGQAKYTHGEDDRMKVAKFMCHDVRTADKFYAMNLMAEQVLEHRRLFEQVLEGADLSPIKLAMVGPSSSSPQKTSTPRRRILLVSSSSSSSSSSAGAEAPAQQEESSTVTTWRYVSISPPFAFILFLQAKYTHGEDDRMKVAKFMCHDVRTADKFYAMNLMAEQVLEGADLSPIQPAKVGPSSSSPRKTSTPRRRILLVSSSSSSSSSSAGAEAPAQQEESTSDSSQGAAPAAATTTSRLMRLARRGNPTVRRTPLKSCLKRKFSSEQLSPLKVRKVVLTKGATLQGMHRNTKGDRRVKKAVQKRRKEKRVQDKKKQHRA
ncbi:hypothetical protein DPX16_2681 [Anabarilius grahami]|uniref:Uncharacterized protein n=1 Tax=Anabarilius grahami TaxID=495550 RepID=A0A3N0YPG5_ANAGA|nr:hypothetical protein DPX16_2681 [Anabarilius grahami]